MVEGIEATFRRADGSYLKVFVPHAVGSPRALCGPVIGPESGSFEVLPCVEFEEFEIVVDDEGDSGARFTHCPKCGNPDCPMVSNTPYWSRCPSEKGFGMPSE